MNVTSISFWIQFALVVAVSVSIVIWIVRFLIMKRRADRYLKELGLKIEIGQTEHATRVVVKPDMKKE